MTENSQNISFLKILRTCSKSRQSNLYVTSTPKTITTIHYSTHDTTHYTTLQQNPLKKKRTKTTEDVVNPTVLVYVNSGIIRNRTLRNSTDPVQLNMENTTKLAQNVQVEPHWLIANSTSTLKEVC